MSGRLLQLSGVVADLLYQVDRVPVAGEEANVRGFSIAAGGGFNAMVAAKRAGMAVSYGGAIGSGPFATHVADGLHAERIPVLRDQDVSRDQGCCAVLIDNDGERTFVASEGAEGYTSDADLSQINLAEFDWILLSGYALHYHGSRDALRRWLETTETIPNLVFDPSPVVAEIPHPFLNAALERATWVSANAQEAAVLTGHTDAALAASVLSAQCPKWGGTVIRTGSNGCIVATAQRYIEIPAYPVQVVDTNGAGDTHVGSFIACLAKGDDPSAAADYANVAAALSTEQKGPATAPTRAVVAEVLLKKKAG